MMNDGSKDDSVQGDEGKPDCSRCSEHEFDKISMKEVNKGLKEKIQNLEFNLKLEKEKKKRIELGKKIKRLEFSSNLHDLRLASQDRKFTYLEDRNRNLGDQMNSMRKYSDLQIRQGNIEMKNITQSMLEHKKFFQLEITQRDTEIQDLRQKNQLLISTLSNEMKQLRKQQQDISTLTELMNSQAAEFQKIVKQQNERNQEQDNDKDEDKKDMPKSE